MLFPKGELGKYNPQLINASLLWATSAPTSSTWTD